MQQPNIYQQPNQAPTTNSGSNDQRGRIQRSDLCAAPHGGTTPEKRPACTLHPSITLHLWQTKLHLLSLFPMHQAEKSIIC